MTTLWRAPRRAYELARDLAAEDRMAQDSLWNGLTSEDQADVVIALGAQARCATRFARTDHGIPVVMPAAVWDRITCADVRAFAIDAWCGARCARAPSSPCQDCLRRAADVLAELHLAALAAIGVPRSRLAEVCARAAAGAR